MTSTRTASGISSGKVESQYVVGFRLALRPFDDGPFDGMGAASLWSREAGLTRATAKREDRGRF
jgi:hypothetical protein